MKRRNIYIASTLVLALVLMVGFPTSARPQVLKGFIKGVVKRLNSPAKTSAIALVGTRKVDAYAKKRIEQQRRRAVRPVVIPPSVQAKLMLEQMKKLRASHNITAPRPKVKPVAQRKPHPQLPKTPRPKPVNAVKAAQPAKAAPAPDPKAAKEKKRKKTIETIIRRFTTYATINSQSWDAYDPTEFPISDGQEEIAELIEQELRTIGSDKDLIVSRSDYQYVYATIPANCEGVPSIMFMAHMDCTPECAGGEITPIVHRNYDGGDIQLPAGITLSPETPQNYLVKVRLRYFDPLEGKAFRQLLDRAAELTAEAFPYVVTEAEPEVMQYENVAYTMYPGLDDLIIEAAEKEGVKLTPRSERGGTTAAMLAAKGQKGGPCLYSGQQAEHSVYEWTCAEDMYQMVMVARSIIETVANQ